MKLPAFQFYPGDWRKDPGVQSLNYHDRGVWFEMICLMHESEQRGLLLLNGNAMPDDALARLLGLDKQILARTITTLLRHGIASRCDKTGALMSRRMVRDEEIRKIRKECGKQGGNPALLNQNTNLVNQKPTTGVNQIPTPSSSSSSSSSPSGIDAKKEKVSGLEGKIRGVPEMERKRPQSWPSLAEVQFHAEKIGLPAIEAEKFWNHFEGAGWVDKNGHPVHNWQSKLVSWKVKFQEEKEKEKRANSGANKPNPRNAGFVNPDKDRGAQAAAMVALMQTPEWKARNASGK